MANDITTFKIIIEGSEGTKVVQGSSSNPLVEGTYEVSKVGLGERLRKASKAAGVSLAVDIVKDAAQFAVRNVGNYTGNSVLQNKTNRLIRDVEYGIAWITNPLMTTINMVNGIIQNELEYSIARNNEENRVARETERAGMNIFRGRY